MKFLSLFLPMLHKLVVCTGFTSCCTNVNIFNPVLQFCTTLACIVYVSQALLCFQSSGSPPTNTVNILLPTSITAGFLPCKSHIALLSQGSPGPQTLPSQPTEGLCLVVELSVTAEAHKEDLEFVFFSTEVSKDLFH